MGHCLAPQISSLSDHSQYAPVWEQRITILIHRISVIFAAHFDWNLEPWFFSKKTWTTLLNIFIFFKPRMKILLKHMPKFTFTRTKDSLPMIRLLLHHQARNQQNQRQWQHRVRRPTKLWRVPAAARACRHQQRVINLFRQRLPIPKWRSGAAPIRRRTHRRKLKRTRTRGTCRMSTRRAKRWAKRGPINRWAFRVDLDLITSLDDNRVIYESRGNDNSLKILSTRTSASLGGCHKEPLESVAQSDRTEKPRELRKARGKQWEILIFPIDGASEPSRWFHEKAETSGDPSEVGGRCFFFVDYNWINTMN